MVAVQRLKVDKCDTAEGLVTKVSQASPHDLWFLPCDAELDQRLSRDLTLLQGAAINAGHAAGPHAHEKVRIVARRTTGIAGDHIVAPNHQQLIVINQGFLLYVYNFMRIVSAHFAFADDPESLPPAPNAEGAARRVTELLDWSSSVLELPRVRTFAITSTQMKKASEFTSVAQMFLVAHEYSHVLLGHAGSDTRWLRVGNREVQTITTSQMHECEADALGLVILTRMLLDSGHDLHPQNYAAIEFLLHGIGLVERFSGQESSLTHPPAELRRQTLRALLSKLRPDAYPALVQNAEACRQMFSEWDPFIVQQTQARRAAVNARVDAAMSTFDGSTQRAILDDLLNEFPTAAIGRLRAELEQWDPTHVPTNKAEKRLYAARSMLFLYVRLGTHPAVKLALVPGSKVFITNTG